VSLANPNLRAYKAPLVHAGRPKSFMRASSPLLMTGGRHVPPPKVNLDG